MSACAALEAIGEEAVAASGLPAFAAQRDRVRTCVDAAITEAHALAERLAEPSELAANG